MAVNNVGLKATGRMLSGEVCKGVFVTDWDEAEARLPVEELLLMVRAGVIVSGTKLTTFCFECFLANGRLICATRSSDGTSAERCLAVDMPEREVNGNAAA